MVRNLFFGKTFLMVRNLKRGRSIHRNPRMDGITLWPRCGRAGREQLFCHARRWAARQASVRERFGLPASSVGWAACLFGGLRCLPGGRPVPWAAQTVQSCLARPSGKPSWALLATALMGAAETPFCPPLSRTTPRHSGTIRPPGRIWAHLGKSGQIWAPTPFCDRHRGLPCAPSKIHIRACSKHAPVVFIFL